MSGEKITVNFTETAGTRLVGVHIQSDRPGENYKAHVHFNDKMRPDENNADERVRLIAEAKRLLTAAVARL